MIENTSPRARLSNDFLPQGFALSKGINCCGSLNHHLGKNDLANEIFRKNILIWYNEYLKNGLDAIISPTGSPAWKTDLINGDSYHIGSSSNAAWSGYPNITVPMGDIHGLPVGLSFFGKAWTEPKLIEIAYSFEQESKSRIIPEFKTTD